VERAGQQRGVPLIVAGMVKMKDFDEYEDAQLLKQKIAACFAVFVVDNADSVLKSDSKNEIEMRERVEPGIIEELPNGKDVRFANPPSTDGYAEYTKQVKQGIAAGVGISYEAMTGDSSNVNFSSGRMGWIEMQREIEDWQWNTFIPQFCDKVWNWFNEGMSMKGIIREPVPTEWTTPRRMMIDPVKETNAKISQIEAGLVSMTEVLAEDGYEFEEVMAKISEEQALIKSLGITLSTNQAPDIPEVKVTS
jgi:lambda family phage portal protein